MPQLNLTLDAMLEQMGDAGRRLSEINANEGASGNISVYTEEPLEPADLFPDVETIDLPIAVPDLAGKTIIVTGSGRRLREIKDDPAGNLGVLIIEDGGRKAALHTSPKRRFQRLTSELNSHLAVHRDAIGRTR